MRVERLAPLGKKVTCLRTWFELDFNSRSARQSRPMAGVDTCAPRFTLDEPMFLLTDNLAAAPGGGARRSRTDDILLAKQALYQLSYSPMPMLGRG